MAFPADRPGTYDETKYFDQATEAWTATEPAISTGRHKTQLVVVGQNDTGEGVVYFGST